ncbi:MAG: hypothetical protein WAU00_10040, partial [Caldilinea sp.]
AEDRATLESDPSAAQMAKWLGQRWPVISALSHNFSGERLVVAVVLCNQFAQESDKLKPPVTRRRC